ncbi:MAG: hypothetical protein P1U53_01385 [Sulfitobacter sp.]|nr:hypothetical protein [Sulfitobacter sp.]
MRPVLVSDFRVALRAICAAEEGDRATRCAMIVKGARLADSHSRRVGRPHALWGNGTLLAAAARFDLAPERPLNRPDVLQAAKLLLTELGADRADV